jgi:carbamoyltransferase
MRGSYLGPEFSLQEIERQLAAAGAKYTVLEEQELLEACVDALEDEQAVGWF